LPPRHSTKQGHAALGNAGYGPGKRVDPNLAGSLRPRSPKQKKGDEFGAAVDMAAAKGETGRGRGFRQVRRELDPEGLARQARDQPRLRCTLACNPGSA